MPLTLRIALYAARVLAVALPLLFVAGATGLVAPAIAGQPVGRETFLGVIGPLLLIAGVLFAVIAYGLSQARPWTRTMVMVLWLVIALYAGGTLALGLVPAAVGWRGLVQAGALAAVTGLYLYRSRAVKTYFGEGG